MSDHQDVLPPGYEESQPWRGPAHSARHRRREPSTGRKWPRRVLAAAAAFVVVVAAVAIWLDSQINPGGHHGPQVSVIIPKGASTSRIGDLLAKAGVIHDGTLFTIWVRLHGDGPLYPGTYLLDRNSSYGPVISALEAGPKILTDRLVIPEGYTVQQIANAVGKLPGLNLSSAKFMAAATDGSVRSRYEPEGVNNLEGLLFPATYDVRQGETESELLGQMVASFEDHASTLGLDSAASSLGMTPYQVIAVASIVEREAKRDSDRPNVASVIYNRLRVGMPLGADSTQTYYLRLTDPGVQPTAAQLDTASPYNTRTNKGLPPTPIASPGVPSLRAATSPPSTSYLYFVEINPDGRLGFASTTAGFIQLRDQCRAANLC
ncbi:MAG TPA: endolytic transglycosylase MltG [Acidimicrobiales bacterium]|nr:endolytic transglycosylase MltG [Acidimicrobiales bacterium]